MTHRHEGPDSWDGLNERLILFVIKIFRDIVIFGLGCFGFMHELFREGSERPQILIGSFAAMGLPFIIRGDEKRQGGKTGETESEGG